MNDAFASYYNYLEELFGLFDSQYNFVFRTVYDESGYIWFGLIALGTCLIGLTLFYKAWHYPYGKLWHWIVWMIILAGISMGMTFYMAQDILVDHLYSQDQNIVDYTNDLVVGYSIMNLLTTMLISVGLSFAIKPFSKVQMHLPA